MVFFPFSACSSLPAEVIYQNPPIIKNKTDITPVMLKSNFITLTIKSVKLLVQAKPSPVQVALFGKQIPLASFSKGDGQGPDEEGWEEEGLA